MRVTLTVLWIALLSLALAVWDCGSLAFGDPLGVCGALRELDIAAPESSGAVVAGVAALGLVASWLPHLRRLRRRRRHQPERALVENIGRLPDPYGGYLSINAESQDMIDDLRRAVEVVETAFATDSADTRSMTSEWMRLLLRANDLHNDGTLPTEEFKQLNTRLLEVVAAPSAATSA
jgi:hypothetical protein